MLNLWAMVDASDKMVGGREIARRTHVRDGLIHQLSPYIQIADNPTHRKVLGEKIITDYRATDFIAATQRYVRKYSPALAEMISKHTEFPVWSRVTLHHDRLPFAPLGGRKIDLIRVSPPVYDRYNRLQRQSHADTVLISYSDQPGIHRT